MPRSCRFLRIEPVGNFNEEFNTCVENVLQMVDPKTPQVCPNGRQLVISTDSELLALTAWMMDGSMTLVAELIT